MRASSVPPAALKNGLCTEPGGPDFFSPLPEDVRRAKNVCALCPVRQVCLQWAVQRPETYGVWGGADQWEIRSACAVKPTGDPVKAPRVAKCPFCRSVKNVTEIRELAGRGSQASCAKCGLTWRRAKSYVKRPRARARSLEFTEIPELPEVA